MNLRYQNLVYLILLAVVLSASAFFYSIITLSHTGAMLNASTIFFVVTLAATALAFRGWVKAFPFDHNFIFLFILFCGILVHVGIFIGFGLIDPGYHFLWPLDAYQMHLPGAQNISNFILGIDDLRGVETIWDKIYFTHIWIGTWFVFFGANPWASGLALLCLKLLAAILIYKLGQKVFDSQIAAFASALYLFSPTILFYTISFYKESVVQFLTIGTALFAYMFLVEQKRWSLFPLGIFSALLLNERFYILVFFGLAFWFTILISNKFSYRAKLSVSILIISSGVLFLNYYSQAHLNFYDPVSTLNHFRDAFNSYSDIDSRANRDLGFLLGFIKILFTPFLTLGKFKMFYGYSYLLIWGSIVNQIVMLFALVGIFRKIYLDPRLHLQFVLPVLLLVLVFAYVSPFNGRLRDSFYPLLCLYSAFGAEIFLNWTKSRFSANRPLQVATPT